MVRYYQSGIYGDAHDVDPLRSFACFLQVACKQQESAAHMCSCALESNPQRARGMWLLPAPDMLLLLAPDIRMLLAPDIRLPMDFELLLGTIFEPITIPRIKVPSVVVPALVQGSRPGELLSRVRVAASAKLGRCWQLAAARLVAVGLFAPAAAPAGRDTPHKAPLQCASWSRCTAAAPTLASRVLRLRGGAQGMPARSEDVDGARQAWEMPMAAGERGSRRVLCAARAVGVGPTARPAGVAHALGLGKSWRAGATAGRGASAGGEGWARGWAVEEVLCAGAHGVLTGRRRETSACASWPPRACSTLEVGCRQRGAPACAAARGGPLRMAPARLATDG